MKNKQLVISNFNPKNIPKMAYDTVIAPKMHNEKICTFCGCVLELQEGVMVYDRNWFHNECWSSYEKNRGINS